ncbi:gephyrin-like molybdotransferase receptor GlpR [Corynebacterium xerosis]|uniref:divisome protein SepX/GlpR n=1 Tax=Corynebacterium xerosis TaxID=1725 RepID=UPI0036709C26
MSSSLLLVLIVVVWLFVLAPLVVNTRQPIRRTSEALGRTRLLHQGGESVATRRRRPTLSERDVRTPDEEVDESLETVDAEFDDARDADRDSGRRADRARDLDDDILIDDLDDARADVPAVVEGDVVYELEPGASGARTAESLDDEAVADDPAEADTAADSLDDDHRVTAAAGPDSGRDADSDAEATAEAGVERADGTAERRSVADAHAADVRAYLSPEDFLVVDDATAATAATADSGTGANPTADSADSADSDAADASADDAAKGADGDEAALIDDDEARGEPDGATIDSADSADAADSVERAGDADDFDDTLTDDDLAFAERRRGRGGFDPVSDARYSETRFARRRRSVGVLAAFIVVGVILGALVGGWTWWVPLAGAGLMVLYLVYLRRTVIAENELRARRIRRMKMARLGVRNSEDEELGVPERLRRPGAVVVELDDEDPDFADLPYATFEFPEEDIRRAAGQ